LIPLCHGAAQALLGFPVPGEVVRLVINQGTSNRHTGHSIKGDALYSAKYVGGHGKGLKQLGLVLVKGAEADDD
jgi:hypothetical protein